MNRLLAMGCAALLTLGATGCGGTDTAEGCMKETISTMNEMAEALKAKNMSRVDELGKKMKDLEERFKKFPESEQQAAMQKHGAEALQATMNMAAAQFGGMGDMFKGMGPGEMKIDFPKDVKIDFPKDVKFPGQ
jgi:hypothetical protein